LGHPRHLLLLLLLHGPLLLLLLLLLLLVGQELLRRWCPTGEGLQGQGCARQLLLLLLLQVRWQGPYGVAASPKPWLLLQRLGP
jgi:hypothetical protein